jgi:hypothetical protein
MSVRTYQGLVFVIVAALSLAACVSAPSNFAGVDQATATRSLVAPSLSAETKTPTLAVTASPAEVTPTVLPTDAAVEGCRKPSDDYTLVAINGHQFNQRTYEMLAYAQSLYNGPIDITGSAITQGSYTNAVEASFGTHAGGGAVDLSVIEPGTFAVLYDEINPLIDALRKAGFAAWFRDFNDLYEGSPVHIHAIAIGDRELSLAAREQLAGPFGYFWGYDGLPQEDGTPQRDPHGGPVICDWMMGMGYPAKTATPFP